MNINTCVEKVLGLGYVDQSKKYVLFDGDTFYTLFTISVLKSIRICNGSAIVCLFCLVYFNI